MISEQMQFKNQFVAAFLAAWSVDKYNDPHERNDFQKRFPMEDACFLADEAWAELKKARGN